MSYTSNRYRLKRTGSVLIVVMLIAGCAAPTATPTATLPRPTPLPTSTQTPTPSPAPIPTAPPSTVSSPAVLDACDTDAQARALRASQLPAWNTLGLNACYELTLELRPDASAYTGTVRVTFTNLAGADLADVVFRTYPNASLIYGGSLDITSAWIEGRPVAPEVLLSDQTAVRLPLPRPLPSGQTILIELDFEGRVPVDFGSVNVYGIFNYDTEKQVLALANWYPILAVWREGKWDVAPVIGEGDAVVSQTALYRVRITAPADWKVIATGSSLDVQRQGEVAQSDFASGPTRDFMLLASPTFERSETPLEDVRVVHWGLPEGESNWDDALQVARDSIAVYTDRFGPYPYAELDIVAAPLRNAAGVEYPGLILIETDLYFGAEAQAFLLITVAHEVAHQWWYGVVGNDVLRAPWQDEALTTYSSALYFEEYAPAFYQDLLDSYAQSVAAFQQDEGDEPVAQPLSAFRGRGNAYGAIVYLKGALFFAELREALGDATFFTALQTYYARNRYALAPPDALLGAFENSCECELDPLYAEWGVATPEP
ncbi:MAG TPA: M1 family aminopeptidase [Anaerolineae bacterium]|nr:M1 family aminopeptidase [Anaerolineae bacterium]